LAAPGFSEVSHGTPGNVGISSYLEQGDSAPAPTFVEAGSSQLHSHLN